MSYGKRIKEARKAAGLTQEQLANMVGLSKSTIACYELGKRNTNAWTVAKIASALNVDVSYIFQDDSNNQDFWSDLDENSLRVAHAYSSLDDLGKELIDFAIQHETARIVPPAKEPPAQESPEKKAPAERPVLPAPKSAPRRKQEVREDGFVELKVFTTQLPAAGVGDYFDDNPSSRIEQYPAEIVPPLADYGVGISGDSMEPRFPNGATAFIENTQDISIGDIGLFSVDGAPLIKQLLIDEEAHVIRLHSLNPERSDVIVSGEQTLVPFGRVLGCYPPGKEIANEGEEEID